MMNIRPIHTEADYQWALEEISRYFDNPPALGSPEGDRFDVLATLLEAHENKHYLMPDADPVDILNFAIADMGRSQAELAEILGSRSRASEVLGRKRRLSLEMINKISEAWRIPLEALAKPYELARKAG